MSYRDAETAFRDRAEDLGREIAALDAEIAAKSAALGDSATSTETLRRRIEREGPGGGEEGARLLRIPLLVGTMLGVGAVALFFQFFLASLVRSSGHEIVPSYVIMSGPTVIGTAVAYRFRSALWPHFLTGLVMTGITIALLLLGAIGVLHVG